MKRRQLIVVLAAVLAVALVGVVGGRGSDKGGKGGGAAQESTPAGAVKVTVASSPEKLALVQDVARKFNATGARVGGRPVVVSVRSAASGDEEIAIAKAAGRPGGDGPTVWSP